MRRAHWAFLHWGESKSYSSEGMGSWKAEEKEEVCQLSESANVYEIQI